MLVCIWIFAHQFLSDMVWWYRQLKLYILIPVWMTWTFIQGHSCLRNQKLLYPFSHIFLHWFGWNSVCCYNLMVSWLSCYVYSIWLIFKGENSTYKCDFINHIVNINLCLDTCESIHLILVRHNLTLQHDSSLNDPDLQSGHRAIGKLDPVQSFCCKVVWSNPNIHDGRLCQGNDSK